MQNDKKNQKFTTNVMKTAGKDENISYQYMIDGSQHADF